MSPRVRVAICVVMAACSSRTPAERERALARIPAQAQLILAADGTALATLTFRRVIDSLTPHVPPSLACVVETALTSQSVVVGAQPGVGVTVVVTTRALVSGCPALSQIDEHTYVATVGAGALAADRASSMLEAEAWARARPYLVREPLAIAAELPALRIIGVAQPEPLDAWLAIDAVDAAGVERAIAALQQRWTEPPTVELAGRLHVTRAGTQVTVHADKLEPSDLVTIVEDTLRLVETPRAAPGTPALASGKYTVPSVAAVLQELAAIESTPVIAGGDIIGIRLLGAPSRLLQRDDVILGVDSHRITERRQLADLAASAGTSIALAVRRNGVDAVIEIQASR